MAEALAVIESIGSSIGEEGLKLVCSQLLKAASPWEEVQGKIKWLKNQSKLMVADIKYADKKKDVDERWKAWVEILRDMVRQFEDIVDEYSHLMGEQHRHGFYGSLHTTFRHCKHIKAWYGIRSKLKQVEDMLHRLLMQKPSDGVQDGPTRSDDSSGRQQHRKEAPYFPDEGEVVGFETYKNLLVGWLTDEEPERTIISVWGMGGLGKTTLVNDVYESQEVKRHFDRRAWVRVSQKYTAEDLMRRLMEDLYNENRDILPGNIDAMPRDSLEETLRSYLQQKRYLIVLDDMWHINRCFDEFGSVLVDSKCRNRIVITTRIHDVAYLAAESHVLELKPLQESDSWILFCNKAFWKDKDRSCPSDLKHWATEILKRCHGLPLAIVAAGSALSYREKEELQWREFCKGLDWGETSMPMSDSVKNILNLSFRDLPYRLRICFLYCSIFPEDYLIKRKRLIRLWAAEGFVDETREGISKEEVAEKNLNELIHRCMLQVVKRNHFRRPKLCRMHDIVRELSWRISKQEYFGTIYSGEEAEWIEARRLSVQKGINDLDPQRGMSDVRSFLVFDMTSFSLKSWISRSTSFRLLRVLDLEGVPLETVPNEVATLFNLRYLGLRRTLVKELPRSSGRLRNLQTLDLYDSQIEKLPRGITQLKNLRHLFVESIRDPIFAELASDPGVKAPKGIWNLKNLQALQSVEADEDMVRHLGNLTQLRTLRITRVRGMHSVELCASIAKMSQLVSLDIVASNEGEALQLEALKPPPYLYQKLELRGQLEHGVLPHWFSSLAGLRHLGLSWSRLREDPLPCLHALPNLAVLGMYKAYDGQELRFHAGGFPKLKFLMLGGSNQLDSIGMEEGALPSLSELCLLRCGGMKLPPQGIEHLTSLQVLYLMEMPMEFIERMRGGNGNIEERQKVQHIPLIKHVFPSGGKWTSETLS
ncbi:disease resistance protein RPM1-like [Cocos nucifera]|uniref:Disease resistance protein RPM1-like n=1 Tax=Cocos nucifera TaxID=13894 RepID=A0A8K0N5D1_COCNU|nr:disease resistance protein RPM1-like [Cocos nucifera]